MKTACWRGPAARRVCADSAMCRRTRRILEQAFWIWYDKATNAIDPSLAKAGVHVYRKELTGTPPARVAPWRAGPGDS